jgi:DNA-binding transcriptional LysR family regulator
MDLTALADFNAVAMYGGFGPAGRALDRPKATLSRRVSELEEELGVRLIERGARRMRLTEDGLALHERTRGLMAELQEAGEAVASRAPVARGRLRISAPIVFAHVLLCQIAARFVLAYPQVELEVVAEDRVVDPVDDGYDLVIRWWDGAFLVTSGWQSPGPRYRYLRRQHVIQPNCPCQPSCRRRLRRERSGIYGQNRVA